MSNASGNIIFAVALGLLAHFLIGYQAFPYGDDFAYGPLADFRFNPDLFARDEQLRMFTNHAAFYDWVYRLGDIGPGVEPVFRWAIWVQAILASLALIWFLRAWEAPVALLPMVLGIGVVVSVDGMGRGDFGGFISPFFHHHNFALVLVLFALSAGVLRMNWLAGALLGLAVFTQPMTAFHGAIVTGLAALFRNPIDAGKMALAAAVTSLPSAWPLVGSILQNPGADAAFDLVQDAYRFRAPAHYDPPWRSVHLTSAYLLAGFLGAVLLMKGPREQARFALGIVLGFLLLHLVTVVVYKGAASDWVGLFILDANRSTPLLYVLGPALALVGMWHAGKSIGTMATAAVLLLILVMNGVPEGIGLVALGAGMIWFAQSPRTRPVSLIAVLACVALTFPGRQLPDHLAEPTRAVLEQIRAQTDQDALFIIPVGLFEFRLIAQRSAYVDFKLFSVAQPDQAALTRRRIQEVVDLSEDNRGKTGWQAAVASDADQTRGASCANMLRLLAQTGATYYLKRRDGSAEDDECPQLPKLMQSATLVLYGPRE